jgi:hypothetical protein
LPRTLLNAAYALLDWSDYELDQPPPGLEWMRVGPDALEINPDTGAVQDAVYGAFQEDADGPGCLSIAQSGSPKAGRAFTPTGVLTPQTRRRLRSPGARMPVRARAPL